MDALSIIDRGLRTVDTAAPTKTAGKNRQKFGKELNEKQQAHESKPVEHQAVDRQSKSSAHSQEKQTVAHSHKTAMKQKKTRKTESSTEAVAESGIQAEKTPQPQVKIQQTLVDLMQKIKTVAEDGPTKKSESLDTIKTLLTDLVQQLNSSEVHGKEVLAGVDLTALTEKLRSLQDDPDHEGLLAQLIVQLQNQLTGQPEIQGNTDLSAAMIAESTQQNTTPTSRENLAQARQILQQAVDAVAPQKTENPVTTENVTTENVTAENVTTENVTAEESAAAVGQPAEETFFADEAGEAVDQRFAGLLKQRKGQGPGQKIQSGKEQAPLHQSKQPVELKQDNATVQVPVTEIEPKVKTSQPPNSGSKQVFENLVQHPQHIFHGQGQQPQVQGLATDKAMPQPPVVQLASGQQVPESQICDQIVTHLSGSVNGESGRMVLRLQPAELGSLKLELKVEGDRIQAHLHAQSHQVQEVLERNLPQLRHALAEQGIKIDQFQVNVDQRQQSGQFENLAQQQQNNSPEKQSGWQQQNLETEEQFIPLAHLMQNGGGGISLHV